MPAHRHAEARDAFVGFKLSASMRDELYATAKERGETVSDLIRESVRITLTASASNDELRQREAS